MEHLAAKHLGAVDQLRRDDPLPQNALLVIDVLAEQIERGDALHQPALDQVPFVGGNDPRHQIKREDFLHPARVAVDGESDALVAEGEIRHPHPAGERGGPSALRRAMTAA